MSRIFLGKPLHWVLVILLAAGGWLVGRQRFHVIEFNLFTILLLVVSAGVIVAVLMTSRPGEQVTRDPLEPDDDSGVGGD
jgi:Mn2+/Fe2+ NRAMP family transporter